MSPSSRLPPTRESLAQADEANSPSEAIYVLNTIIKDDSTPDDWQTIKIEAIIKLSILLAQEKRNAGEIQYLLFKALPLLPSISCVQAVKVCRSIIDAVAKAPGGASDIHIWLYTEIAKWSRVRNQTYLRQQMEESLARLLIDWRKFSEASNLLSRLEQESRTSGDNLMLIRVCLIQTKLHLSCQDLPKAKAALTEARELAESLEEMPGYDQAMIDMQSGIYHAEAGDYLTGDTYFGKACSAFDHLKDPTLVQSLRYMVICKIMLDRVDDVAVMASEDIRSLYQSEEFEGMRAVADAWGKRSLKMFVTALKDYKDELRKDAFVHKHLDLVHGYLLEDDLQRLIGPDSRVEIVKLAELFELPADKVEKHLSEMIVDKKLAWSLDEVAGCLISDDDAGSDIISGIRKIVDALKPKYGE